MLELLCRLVRSQYNALCCWCSSSQRSLTSLSFSATALRGTLFIVCCIIFRAYSCTWLKGVEKKSLCHISLCFLHHSLENHHQQLRSWLSLLGCMMWLEPAWGSRVQDFVFSIPGLGSGTSGIRQQEGYFSFAYKLKFLISAWGFLQLQNMLSPLTDK